MAAINNMESSSLAAAANTFAMLTPLISEMRVEGPVSVSVLTQMVMLLSRNF
jgi:hypothetical protein